LLTSPVECFSPISCSTKYSDHRVVIDRTVDSHIRNLRRKLEQACPEETPIESLHGVGYGFQLADA